MEAADYLAIVPEQAATAAEAAEATGLGAAVPSCPGWDVGTLVGHVGRVHRWATGLVSTGATEPMPMPEEVPGAEDVLPWLRAGADDLVRVLAAKGPTAPAWNWVGAPPEASFWFRRMAHETTLHCWDVRAAGGDPPALPAELASDGIDELLTYLLPPRRRNQGLSGTLHVHCTDVPGEWTVDLATWRVTREHVKADAALRGPASDLYLRLTNRATGGEAFGEDRILARWRESVGF